MKIEDIKVGMTVSDPTIKVFYEWVNGFRRIDNLETIHILCSLCSSPSKFMLHEKEPVINTLNDFDFTTPLSDNTKRRYYCIKCAGIEDLVPLFTVVQ